MKILRFAAENIKKLKVVSIDPQGNVINITGPNDSGKSSVLDSIVYALGGGAALPSTPVRAGARRGKVRLDLGEYVVTRKFTAEGTTSLLVESAEGGEIKSPQKLLDRIRGNLGFDPLAFADEKDSRKQLEVLRSVVRLDVDVDALDRANATDYQERTAVNRELRDLEGRIQAIAFPPDTPAEPIDTSALLDEITTASQHNMAVEREVAERARITKLIHDAYREATELRASAEALEREAIGAKAELDARPIPEEGPRDVTEIRARIEIAKNLNKWVTARTEKAKLLGQLAALGQRQEALTDAMKDRAEEKQRAFAGANMPVPGLEFGDGEVRYNGVPFAQASRAQQTVVSFGIAAALNPNLRVVLIKDGSLLDSKHLGLIAALAEEKDMQVWLERVDESGCVGIVMEDGMVKGSAEVIADVD